MDFVVFGELNVCTPVFPLLQVEELALYPTLTETVVPAGRFSVQSTVAAMTLLEPDPVYW